MMNFNAKTLIFFSVAFSLLWHPGADAFDQISPDKIAVLSSMDIRPFVEAVEGISRELNDSGMGAKDVFDLQKYLGKKNILRGQLAENGYEFCIAVGPEAAQFAMNQTLPFIYTMILSPENISGTNAAVCGISLNIPVREQLEAIHRTLPDVHTVGLLFDRHYNSKFFSDAREIAGEVNLEIVPLEVVSKKEIPKVLKEHWGKIDALWFIPDETVISESVIEYINKEALLNEVPTIGYNRFFYKFGSLISFVFDYQVLGQQAAWLALSFQSGGSCIGETPQYSLWINERVMKRLGARVVSNNDVLQNTVP